jgi:hypothetical protein
MPTRTYKAIVKDEFGQTVEQTTTFTVIDPPVLTSATVTPATGPAGTRTIAFVASGSNLTYELKDESNQNVTLTPVAGQPGSFTFPAA